MVMNRLLDFLILIGLYAIATFIHLLGHMIAARLAGLKIEKVSFFYIPVFKFQTPAFPLEIGILPVGGSVKLSEEFEKNSLPVKWLVTISGSLFVAISVVIVLSFDKAWLAFITGFGQIIYGAISPIAYGATLIQKFFAEDLAASVFTAYGILAAKLVAINLLPLATLNGGQMITALFPNFHDSKWGGRFSVISLLVMLAIYISWGVALVVYLFR
jgi:hypothetical protein